MTYYNVIIVHSTQNNEIARLTCDTLEEALEVKRSFENYGKYQEICIEKEDE